VQATTRRRAHNAGIAGTRFWVDPKEELIGVVLPQVLFLDVPLDGAFQNVVYAAIED